MSTDSRIKSELEQLEARCQIYEREGRFTEAEEIKRRTNDLLSKERDREIFQLKNKHYNERLQAQETHAHEFQEFTSAWQERLDSLAQTADQQLGAMQARHDEERTQLLSQLDNQLPNKPKPSSDLLNYRKILEGLIRRKDYGEAAKVQEKVDSLERSEQRAWDKNRRTRIQTAEAALHKRHEQEHEVLKKRLQAVENEHIKRKEAEHEKLLQKYQNTLKAIESEQNQELNRRSSPTKSLII
mmetsp:Transcript_19615/g.36080  ORF Transcript_19615/g.36080 Transcript_19615/m.36080 type:complete len:242 (+) Transcript_19615:824-1549(+)